MNKYGLIVVLVLLLYGVYFLNQKEQKVELINTTDEKEAAIPKENKKLTSASLENSVNSEQKRTKPSSQASPSSPFSNKKEPDTEKETTSDQQKPNDIITTMPSSYPIEEAEKYFLPPEERTSGHIGGPPPLNFPKLGN